MDELLEEVKSYLNFTWEDEPKERRIQGYINSSIQYLKEMADAEIDFDTDYLARDLLFNRVLYMDSQALDDFEKNYSGMLKELQIKYAVINTDDQDDSDSSDQLMTVLYPANNADENTRESVQQQDPSV